MEHRVMSALRLTGSTSGYSEITPPAVAGDQTFTLPETGGTLTTTNGGQTIEHAAGTASAPSITFTGDVNTGIFSPAADTIAFAEGGVEAARIDSSGRLLVGTSTNYAGYKLQVVHSDASGLLLGCFNGGTNYLSTLSSNGSEASKTVVTNGQELFQINVTGYDGSANRTAASISAQVDGTPGANDMPGRLVFSTTADGASSPTERMRITSAGSLGLFSNANGVHSYSSLGANTNDRTFIGAHSSSGVFSGTISFTVFTNGNVVNTNNSYGSISDIKLKENIVGANSQWDDLKALQVRNYNFKEGQTHTQIGLIAQEVELVSPGLVSESPDRDEEGNDLGTTTKSVNYSVLYMKAVKALQEAMERIETLEAQNATFEARLAALEAN